MNEESAMPYKQLFFCGEAREKILRGAAALADAVRVTLGPKSRTGCDDFCAYPSTRVAMWRIPAGNTTDILPI
jgi:hypothetical protein